jgi:RNA polymerase sigma factor (sigma-70 family)
MRQRPQDVSYDEFAAAQMRRLLGFAYTLTGNQHDAWDLTQETLARVAEKWRKVRDNPAAYARTVMVRLNIDRVRHLQRVRVSEETPDSAVEPRLIGEVDAWLVEALATLSARQRTAVALRHIEDLDLRQIAERMGCAEGTARSHLSRGTERLRDYARAAGITAGQEQER